MQIYLCSISFRFVLTGEKWRLTKGNKPGGKKITMLADLGFSHGECTANLESGMIGFISSMSYEELNFRLCHPEAFGCLTSDAKAYF
jgi:hypothetical protein